MDANLNARRVLILMEHENERARREIVTGDNWLCDHTAAIDALNDEFNVVMEKTTDPGPTSRDVVELALRLAEREIVDWREWPSETECSNTGTQAYK